MIKNIIFLLFFINVFIYDFIISEMNAMINPKNNVINSTTSINPTTYPIPIFEKI